jgi:hypothetical protein
MFFFLVSNFYQFKGEQHQKKIFLKDFFDQIKNMYYQNFIVKYNK